MLPAFWGLSSHLWGLMRFFIYRHFCYLYYIFCITNIHIPATQQHSLTGIFGHLSIYTSTDRLSPEHVSGAGTAEFPLAAQAYFCDSRRPLPAPFPAPRPLAPAVAIFSHPHSPLRSPHLGPLRSRSNVSSSKLKKWTDFYPNVTT